MTRTGWIRLHRSLLKHPLMNKLPASWFRVWVVILLKTNWEAGTWWEGSKEIEIKPGSLVTSLEGLATMSGSSVGEVRGALKYFEKASMATSRTTNCYRIISITNWATYQNAEDIDDKPDDIVNGMPAGADFRSKRDDNRDDKPDSIVNGGAKANPRNSLDHHEAMDATNPVTSAATGAPTTIEEIKNLRKEHMSNSGELDLLPGIEPNRKPRTKRNGVDQDIQRWFDAEFWPIYPRHEGKKESLKAANKKATTPVKRAYYLERLKAQLPEYLRRKAESGQRVIPLGATWFNQDRHEDEFSIQEPSRNGRPVPVENDYPEYVPLEARNAGN
jgi:hypothetical protein